APATGHVEPRQLVCAIITSVHAHLHTTRHLTRAELVADTLQPAKFAGIFVVMQQLAQPRARKSRMVFHGRSSQNEKGPRSGPGTGWDLWIAPAGLSAHQRGRETRSLHFGSSHN